MKKASADWFLPPQPDAVTLWVAYSGGLDSTVLLHRLARDRKKNLRAVHVHHGLQAAADDWARHCRQQCRRLHVPLTVLRVKVPRRHSDGPEAAAREARYNALHGIVRKNHVLVTAHHRNDQAETLLLRLLRGTGLAGLSGIRELAEFGRGCLWRPLLETPREQLRAYAAQHELSWIEDPHNLDSRFARSYLRRELLPRLASHWPQALPNIARTARLAAEASQLLDELAAQDLRTACAGEDALSVSRLLGMNAPRRNNLLRYWLARRGWSTPSAAALQRLHAEVLQAKSDAAPLLRCGNCEFRRYRDQLYAMSPLPPPPAALKCEWRGSRLLLPPGCGSLRRLGRLTGPLTVRWASGGERIRLRPGARARTLKNLFQERGLPPWVRQRLPLIYRGEELIAVADLWLSETADGLRLEWHQDLPGAIA